MIPLHWTTLLLGAAGFATLGFIYAALLGGNRT